MKPRCQQTSEFVGPEAGVKLDEGKPQLGLLFMAKLLPAVVSLVRVLEYGARKYPSADNWAKVENGVTRYRDAVLRHTAARASGEANDPESGLPHMAHAACSALFSLALELAE